MSDFLCCHSVLTEIDLLPVPSFLSFFGRFGIWIPNVVANSATEGILMIGMALLFLALGVVYTWSNKKIKRLKSQLKAGKQALEQEQTIRAQTEETFAATKEQADKALAEAQEAVKQAEIANQAKGTFLATMSHEIRTPLNCILGLAEVLMATEPTDEQKDYLDSIRSSVNALLGIIGNVLDYSKIESGNLELRPERFSMNDLLNEVNKLFYVSARQKGIEFQCKMGSDVPLHIICDRNHLRQVIINLVGNAIKFTERGEVVISVNRERLSPEQSPSPGKVFYKVIITVADTGIGIPEERRDELFKPFHQLVSSKTRKYEGTGLGLAICKKVVEAMEGEITIEKNEPQGTLFKAHLLLEGFSVKKPTQPPIDSLGGRGLYKHALGSSFYSHRILVADDNPLNCKVMKAMMEKMGHQAEFVNNGLDAIQYLRKNKVDLIFMDIMMPVCDGIEATEKIRAGEAGEEHKDVPIVALTAFALTSDREKFLSCGMDFYLTKPVEPEFLRELLTTLARKNRNNPPKRNNDPNDR